VILSGFLAGSIHVLAGVDHMTAVAPFVMRRPRYAWIIGLIWGMGHASGIIIVFVLALLFKHTLNLHFLSSWSETMVGFMLIGIGLWGIRSHSKLINQGHSESHFHAHTSFGVGIIHGLAGSSHFLGILPALAFPPSTMIIYLIGLGFGTLCVMSGFTAMLGILSSRFAWEKGALSRRLLIGCCSVTTIVGVFWLFL
jgi:hypothetical protein